MILPGASLGIFGGGQLGRMFVTAARTMGYRTIVFDPDEQSPAGIIADKHLCCDYADEVALDQFADTCAALTLEFENIPLPTLEYVENKSALLYPVSSAVAIAQDRIREKIFLNACGAATVQYRDIHHSTDIDKGFAELEAPLLLKTTRFGYDGKGQYEVATAGEAHKAFSLLDAAPCVLEKKVKLKREVSVVIVRGEQGDSVCYPIAENVHRQGILHTSSVPAGLDTELTERVHQTAILIAESLDYHGVLAVEFFITETDDLYVNEIAPRPHNSGHYTLDACMTSQFAQQVRVMCGLPVGAVDLTSPAVMVNILGDAWRGNKPPDWHVILSHPNACLHLYGKTTPRPGRKMGHFCLLGEDYQQLRTQAQDIYQELMHHAGSV